MEFGAKWIRHEYDRLAGNQELAGNQKSDKQDTGASRAIRDQTVGYAVWWDTPHGGLGRQAPHACRIASTGKQGNGTQCVRKQATMSASPRWRIARRNRREAFKWKNNATESAIRFENGPCLG
ncbi:hypothetical protein CGZ80_06225 [Rhodopirellula sp. MGV]|nr:hypothetical protein CGZ80_06225 [Rhodopirellula sp. MGV]PNY36281.1 hypothetical protein C2E31_14365 [Rhodopirellula baltica]